MTTRTSSAALASLRVRFHRALDPRARPRGLSPVNRLLVGLILLSAALAVVETEPLIAKPFAGLLGVAEWSFGVVFTLEYLARLWSAPEDDPTVPAWRARLGFVMSPAAVIDLASITACFAPTVYGGGLLRLFRLIRILRLAKLGRMTSAWQHLADAIRSRKDELLLSMVAGLALMLVSATVLYMVEGTVQPDKFGSIPRSLWWSVATLTTIGYGDVFPITPLGKIFASITALTSIGLVAMPTGILAAAFSEAVQEHRRALDRPNLPPSGVSD